MEKIVVKGGYKLSGEVNIDTAKNSVLPIIAASILCGDRCCIKNSPRLEDVNVICNLLRSMKADIEFDGNDIYINTRNMVPIEPNKELVGKMRASFFIMGPMLARFRRFKTALPGGCNIGSRPIDLHLKGLAALGATITQGHGYVEATAPKLKGNRVYLDFPSVGATENILMAAIFAEGETIIENAAAEPEIEDLAAFINYMGGKIIGAGTDTINIIGVNSLHGTTHTPIYDRIEAGTFMVAAAITRSKIKINGVKQEHLKPVVAKLKECGVIMETTDNGIIVNATEELCPVDIKTMPYPGFPTDMQAQMMSLMCTVPGTSLITETVFENRFMHASELKRMGANIKIDGRIAIVEGIEKLSGAEVKASDLRAGAALILAGLAADGITTVNDIYHLDRGYVEIEKKLKKLGAEIKRTI
ncbi:UDP-N-acetylglucosamine 1-carboxyvinyltransferase [Clostridium oryzae]|uniref:UDP-N-acetylglucosamine 1-carboxyvinyltransferase n=1 Tax=Clostridium oryzae TaxID=1450648 RepID=A0A1V4ITT5_9CLOT|nr:UDP-N-acetylglucosamine 1-carboxyvinyltransferase [Clostridium oryzae]OPJ63432.1 UDP-N-acetylglucosamine 1-carboxyvinyltransferase 1 [Clostridium oryzae]